MSEAVLSAVVRGIAFIEANLCREIGVSDVADAVNYSQFYFSREFTRRTRISIYDYILRRKLSESYKELFGKRCRIVDLAFRYGFQSHEVYTRAFRKMFGENPSEAHTYKPLAVYEPIDEAYLDFLTGLCVERMNQTVSDRRFQITGASATFEPAEELSALVLFAPDNSYRHSCTLHGELHEEDSRNLSVRFPLLRHTLRIQPSNPRFALRYYCDNLYEGSLPGGNCLLLRPEKTHIDFWFPDAQ